MFVEPGNVQEQLAAEFGASQRYRDSSRQLVFDRSDAPLHNSDAAMLAYRAIARWLDAVTFPPISESLAIEDAVPVTDVVQSTRPVRSGPDSCAATVATLPPSHSAVEPLLFLNTLVFTARLNNCQKDGRIQCRSLTLRSFDCELSSSRLRLLPYSHRYLLGCPCARAGLCASQQLVSRQRSHAKGTCQ